MNTSRDWKRMAWLGWLSYFKRRYGHEYDGPTPESYEEWKVENEILLTERRELKKIRDWDGQYSADEEYEGVLDEESFIKLYGSLQNK
jgi:hypothetical protein